MPTDQCLTTWGRDGCGTRPSSCCCNGARAASITGSLHETPANRGDSGVRRINRPHRPGRLRSFSAQVSDPTAPNPNHAVGERGAPEAWPDRATTALRDARGRSVGHARKPGTVRCKSWVPTLVLWGRHRSRHLNAATTGRHSFPLQADSTTTRRRMRCGRFSLWGVRPPKARASLHPATLNPPAYAAGNIACPTARRVSRSPRAPDCTRGGRPKLSSESNRTS